MEGKLAGDKYSLCAYLPGRASPTSADELSTGMSAQMYYEVKLGLQEVKGKRRISILCISGHFRVLQ